MAEAAEYLTIAEAALRLGVDPKTIRRMIATSRLAGYRVSGTAMIRVAVADVEALLQPIPTVTPAA